MQPDPGITVNCCGDAAMQPRRAEEAGLRALLLRPHDRAAGDHTARSAVACAGDGPPCYGANRAGGRKRGASSAHLRLVREGFETADLKKAKVLLGELT
jgi:hypothetical protein